MSVRNRSTQYSTKCICIAIFLLKSVSGGTCNCECQLSVSVSIRDLLSFQQVRTGYIDRCVAFSTSRCFTMLCHVDAFRITEPLWGKSWTRGGFPPQSLHYTALIHFKIHPSENIQCLTYCGSEAEHRKFCYYNSTYWFIYYILYNAFAIQFLSKCKGNSTWV